MIELQIPLYLMAASTVLYFLIPLVLVVLLYVKIGKILLIVARERERG